VHVYVYLCIYIHIYICVCVCVCMYVCMYVSMYLCVYLCVYLCIYVSMYLCIYISMYLYINTHACEIRLTCAETFDHRVVSTGCCSVESSFAVADWVRCSLSGACRDVKHG
jgi:hypothetical protein